MDQPRLHTWLLAALGLALSAVLGTAEQVSAGPETMAKEPIQANPFQVVAGESKPADATHSGTVDRETARADHAHPSTGSGTPETAEPHGHATPAGDGEASAAPCPGCPACGCGCGGVSVGAAPELHNAAAGQRAERGNGRLLPPHSFREPDPPRLALG